MDMTTNTITANTYMTTTNTSPYIPYSTQAMENLIFKVAEPVPSDIMPIKLNQSDIMPIKLNQSAIMPIKLNQSAIEISKDTGYVYYTGFGGGEIAKSTNAKVALNIKNIKLLPNEESPRVVIVEFEDGSTEKAVTAKGDTFDFETGLSICLTKRILAALTGTNCGTKLYNDMIKQAVRAYDEIKEERAKEQEIKEIADRKRAKKIAKKKARDERRRKAAINDQKEAYVQAMLELKSRQGDDGR